MRVIAALLIMLSALPVAAQERATIGNGRLFTNDIFGDGRDRWRTGSYVFSHLRAPRPYDGHAQGFGELLEYRLRAEVIAPGRVGRSGADRPYVGALSFGVHTHFGLGMSEVSLGVDVTAIGPRTGLADFQRGFHDVFGLPAPLIADALDNDVFLSGAGEVRTTIAVGPDVTFRPFVAAEVGVEDLVRLGGDLMIGPIAQTDLMLRDPVTGQLYRGTQSGGSGFAFVLGGDIAAVGDSAYLPAEQGYRASTTRTRARAGLHYQMSEDVTFFYGMTYLSEEFVGQPEGQVLGSVKLNFNF